MSKDNRFEKLFEPGRIGQMTIRNRIVMPPMQTNFAAKDGSVGEEIKGYYGARARGGVGLVITEASPIMPGNAYYRPVLATDDKFIPGLSQLAKAIQKHGARAAYQLVDYRTSNMRPECEPVGPSPAGPRGEVQRVVTEDEIADIIAEFAKAALRVKKAGFDGVEIHGAPWLSFGPVYVARLEQTD